MIKIGIIDDEKHAIDTMKAMLSRIETETKVVFEASEVEEAVSLLQQHQVDLIFLDIQLKSHTGFHILERFPNREFNVIFVTAYNQYAIEAFQFAALNYILKPVKLSDVRESILRVSEKLHATTNYSQFQIASQNLQTSEHNQKKITLPTGNEMIIVKLSDIIRLEANGNYTWFHFTGDKNVLISRTMKEFEALLQNNGFYRLHQSHIVNLDHISKYSKSNGGEIIMSDNTVVPIARQKKEELVNIIKKLS